MATVTWTGKRQAVAQIDTVTYVAGVGTTYTATITGSNRSVAYLGVTGDTASTIAQAVADLWNNDPNGEFKDLTATANDTAGVGVWTGLPDGTPCVLTVTAAGGAGTATLVHTAAPKGPNDAADVLNYSSGALPSAADTLVFENTAASVLFNLTALTTITLTKVTRKRSFTGSIGRPRISENGGYQEYRTRFLELDAPTIEFELAENDTREAFNTRSVSASAVAVNVIGTTNVSSPGDEPLVIYGTPANSTLNVIGQGVRVAPDAAHTATFATIRGSGCSLFLGAGVTNTTGVYSGCTVLSYANYTTITADRGTGLRIGGAAAGTTTNVQGGTLAWQSSGTPGAVNIGSDGVFDAEFAPAAFAVGTITFVGDGGELHDPNARLTKTYTLVLSSTSLDKIKIDAGTGHGMTITV